MEQLFVKDIYYTSDHEWVSFHNNTAHAGICRFKLTGFREVEQIIFPLRDSGFRKQGDQLAIIIYKDYKVVAHMPVDGEVLGINDKLLNDPALLLIDPEGEGWITQISLLSPDDKGGLLSPEQYRKKNKSYLCDETT